MKGVVRQEQSIFPPQLHIAICTSTTSVPLQHTACKSTVFTVTSIKSTRNKQIKNQRLKKILGQKINERKRGGFKVQKKKHFQGQKVYLGMRR